MAVVLIVDDEFGIMKLLEDVLTDEGHRVLTASNGRQALERAAEEKPALVVTDFMMPIMDGAALVKAMAADARLADIPVVIMSSMPEATVAERSPGYVAFVRKPFNIFADCRPRSQADRALVPRGLRPNLSARGAIPASTHGRMTASTRTGPPCTSAFPLLVGASPSPTVDLGCVGGRR